MAKRSNDMSASDMCYKPSRRSAYFNQWHRLQADLLDESKRDSCLVYCLLPGAAKDGPLFEPVQGMPSTWGEYRQIYLAGWPALITSGSKAVMPLLEFTPTHVTEELSNRSALIASGSGAGRQCLAFTPARVTDRPYNLPALNANGPSAVQPSGLSQSDVSEHPSNSPNQDARGLVDEMPRPEVQVQMNAAVSLLQSATGHSMLPKGNRIAVAKGAQFNQPRPAIPGQFTGKAKKAAAPPKASAKERHSQPPPVEDDGSGVGEKGKRIPSPEVWNQQVTNSET
eukprot:gene9621-7535_t